MQNKNTLFGILAAILLALACANPLGTPVPQDEFPNVETVVAATLSALTATLPPDAAPQTPPAPVDSAPSLLPRSMYFLANDAAQYAQVFRLERDGRTITQLTSEPAKVTEYDVSLADGSVVFVSNNQLILINADGSNRRASSTAARWTRTTRS